MAGPYLGSGGTTDELGGGPGRGPGEFGQQIVPPAKQRP